MVLACVFSEQPRYLAAGYGPRPLRRKRLSEKSCSTARWWRPSVINLGNLAKNLFRALSSRKGHGEHRVTRAEAGPRARIDGAVPLRV